MRIVVALIGGLLVALSFAGTLVFWETHPPLLYRASALLGVASSMLVWLALYLSYPALRHVRQFKDWRFGVVALDAVVGLFVLDAAIGKFIWLGIAVTATLLASLVSIQRKTFLLWMLCLHYGVWAPQFRSLSDKNRWQSRLTALACGLVGAVAAFTRQSFGSYQVLAGALIALIGAVWLYIDSQFEYGRSIEPNQDWRKEAFVLGSGIAVLLGVAVGSISRARAPGVAAALIVWVILSLAQAHLVTLAQGKYMKSYMQG